MSFWRLPRYDATWAERREFHDAARKHAAADPLVRRELARARVALDRLLEHPEERARDDFWGAIARVAAAAVAAAPPLLEIATPVEGGLPVLAREIAAALCEDRIAHDQHPRALEALDALRRDALRGPRAAFLRPRDELRRELIARGVASARRRRGRPPGHRRGDLPEELEELLTLVRPVVLEMRRAGRVLNVQNVAVHLGIDERRLREAFEHHGIRGPAIVKWLGRADRAR